MTEKTPQLEALEEIQQMISDLPEQARADVLMFAEDIRDILKEGQSNAFLALTLVSLEFGTVHAEQEKEKAENGQVVAG